MNFNTNYLVGDLIQQPVSTRIDAVSPKIGFTESLMLEDPAVGLGLLTGLFGLLLAFLWLHVRRLSALVQRRDRQLQKLSSTDPLTGLTNRSELYRLGNQLLKQDPKSEMALLQVNLDRFKSVNELLGQAAGDDLLYQASQRLQSLVCPPDTVARTGSDEFALLMRSPSQDAVRQIAERVLQVLAQPFYVQGQIVNVGGSLGISFSGRTAAPNACQFAEAALSAPLTDEPGSFNRLLTQAGIAMLQAKPSQRRRQYWPTAQPDYLPGQCAHDQYAIFHPFMRSESLATSQRQQELSAALSRQEFRVHYQPIVDLQSAQAVGFEALVRWQHPEHGLLYPSDFLPLAEEMELIAFIDRWVLQTSCQQLATWRDKSPQMPPHLSVNLSGAHLSQPGLVDYVQSLLVGHAIAPQQLNLEITENVLITDPHGVIDTLKQIKQLGLGVSLDDFGTGYSSLSYLQQFPVDVLKIDRAFVSHLGSTLGPEAERGKPIGLAPDGTASGCADDPQEVIIQAILDLAEGLNISVVAEGIERSDQLCRLKQLRCSYGQGHFFSEAISAPLAQALLR